jgi:hypothetical protein
MVIARLSAAGLVAVVLPAVANDTLATLGAGGLTPLKSSTIFMESEDLEISVHQIAVHYTFRNTSDRDVNEIVAFPLPELAGGLLANSPVRIPSKDPLNFVDFRVLVDGKPVAAKVESRAFVDKSEITTDLRSMGVPASPLDETVTAAFRKAPQSQQARFEKNGWIDCKLTGDGKCWPMWQARFQFYWTQRFPARTAVEVRHTYSPIVGGSYVYSDDTGASSLRPYCGDADALDQVKKQKALHPPKDRDSPALLERRIQYILTTAKNWSGAIRTFRLSLITDAADDIVATCMPGLTRIAPARYELMQPNFRPDRELEVLFLQPAN